MLEFCGQEQCIIDANGRLKLSSTWLRDYSHYEDKQVVLYCLPEGAIGVYPMPVWQRLRGSVNTDGSATIQSWIQRREHRRFGAMTTATPITNQGRITIPEAFRDYAQLTPNGPVMTVGCEVGVELWNCVNWNKELQLIQQHMIDKGEQEMHADLKLKEIE